MSISTEYLNAKNLFDAWIELDRLELLIKIKQGEIKHYLEEEEKLKKMFFDISNTASTPIQSAVKLAKFRALRIKNEDILNIECRRLQTELDARLVDVQCAEAGTELEDGC